MAHRVLLPSLKKVIWAPSAIGLVLWTLYAACSGHASSVHVASDESDLWRNHRKLLTGDSACLQ